MTNPRHRLRRFLKWAGVAAYYLSLLAWLVSFWLLAAGAEISTWIPPLLGVVFAIIYLWRRDCHYPPGHCQSCEYNLTGNESGVCPECGIEIKKP